MMTTTIAAELREAIEAAQAAARILVTARNLGADEDAVAQLERQHRALEDRIGELTS